MQPRNVSLFAECVPAGMHKERVLLSDAQASLLRKHSGRPPLYGAGGRPLGGAGVSLWRPRMRETLQHKACCSAGLLFRRCTRGWSLRLIRLRLGPVPRELIKTPGGALQVLHAGSYGL